MISLEEYGIQTAAKMNCRKVHILHKDYKTITIEGCLVAVGCNNGNTALMELSDSLSVRSASASAAFLASVSSASASASASATVSV